MSYDTAHSHKQLGRDGKYADLDGTIPEHSDSGSAASEVASREFSARLRAGSEPRLCGGCVA